VSKGLTGRHRFLSVPGSVTWVGRGHQSDERDLSGQSSIRGWSSWWACGRRGGSIRTAAVGRGHDYTRARRDRPARRARERRVLPAAPLVAEGIEGEGEDPAGEGHPRDLGAASIRDRVGEPVEPGRPGGPDLRGGLDHRPAQPAAALLADVAAPDVVGRAAFGRGKTAHDARWSAEGKRPTSHTSATIVAAVRIPMPGIGSSRRTRSSSRNAATISRSAATISRAMSSINRRFAARRDAGRGGRVSVSSVARPIRPKRSDAVTRTPASAQIAWTWHLRRERIARARPASGRAGGARALWAGRSGPRAAGSCAGGGRGSPRRPRRS